MSRRPVLFDVTHFVQHPSRTGVQRVCFEVVSRWPADDPLVPARVSDSGHLDLLPDSFFEAYAAYFRSPWDQLADAAGRIRELAGAARRVRPAGFREFACFLRTEVLNDPPRVRFAEWAVAAGFGDWLRPFVYDLLLWTRPEFFPPGSARDQYGWLRSLRAVRQVAFDSDQARAEYRRLVREPSAAPGPVIPPGADGLGAAAPRFDPASRRFAMVGTIEPRKNHVAVLDAFERLWAEGVDVELVMAGGMGWVPEEVRRRVANLAETEPRFRWVRSVSDAELVDVIRSCRATVYAAVCEGYGLPPLESLALGVPTIVTADLPSIQMLAPAGQVRLAAPNGATVAEAVRRLLDDAEARRLTDEIRGLRLPTWADFGRRMYEWVRGA